MKIFISVLLLFDVVLFSNDVKAQPVLINELMSSNVYSIADEDGDYSDWIELFNPNQDSVDLAGYGLSDDLTKPY